MSSDQIKSLIGELDYDGNSKINYSEFLAATVEVSTMLTHDKLMAIFKGFDLENKNELTVSNIKDAMSKLGKEVNDAEIENIMKKHDVN